MKIVCNCLLIFVEAELQCTNGKYKTLEVLIIKKMSLAMSLIFWLW
jgi:hypothetical protein